MITAVDTNVLLDILLPDERFHELSEASLEQASSAGLLVICDIVYGELCAHFATQREIDLFLESTGIKVDPLNRTAHFLASRIWLRYRKQGGRGSRALADFLIGAHAQTQADRLLSRDRGFYEKLFPSLRRIDPST